MKQGRRGTSRRLRGADDLEQMPSGALELRLNANDPLAEVEVFSAVNELGECLLVDPYCHQYDLVKVVRHTRVNRVLVGSGARGDIAGVVGAVSRPFEVCTTSDIHDRYTIPKVGSRDDTGYVAWRSGRTYALRVCCALRRLLCPRACEFRSSLGNRSSGSS